VPSIVNDCDLRIRDWIVASVELGIEAHASPNSTEVERPSCEEQRAEHKQRFADPRKVARLHEERDGKRTIGRLQTAVG
jgi:hypothetical protein